MNPEDCYYHPDLKTLIGSKKDKVRTYLRKKLISAAGPFEPGIFVIKPTKNRHIIHHVNMKDGTCTCQAFIMGDHQCSHILAVGLFLEQVKEGGRNLYDNFNPR